MIGDTILPGFYHDPIYPKLHPLKIFDIAQAEGRYVHVCAPMVRYSKLAFRQTVHHYGTDICYTPMILAKEFNRSAVARDSDLTMSTLGGPQQQPVTIAQFGSNSPQELSRAASLAAPFVNGIDLNCGCPQSWACAQTLGAALMEKRELVRDAVVETRDRLRRDGWAVDLNSSTTPHSELVDSPLGRSVSVKIRVHKDLRKTVDWIETVLGDDDGGGSGSGSGSGTRNIDWLTIHPRTRNTPSSHPINVEALSLLAEKFGKRVPILVSGDVFTLSTLPYDNPTFFTTTSTRRKSPSSSPSPSAPASSTLPQIANLRGLMSARSLLANPALFAGHETCPWEAVDFFLKQVTTVAPLPFKLGVHHLSEMCGPGYGPDKRSLLTKKERVKLVGCDNWIDVLDFMEEVRQGGKKEEAGEEEEEEEKGSGGGAGAEY